MEKSAETFIPDTVKEILEEIAESNIKGVALFALRSALRVLPLVANTEGSFNFKQDDHLHDVWKALYLGINADTATTLRASEAYASREFATTSAITKLNSITDDDIEAANDSTTFVVATIANAITADYSARTDANHKNAAVNAIQAANNAIKAVNPGLRQGIINEVNEDLLLLQSRGLEADRPLWNKHNLLEKETEYFFRTCQENRLTEVIDDYLALVKGGATAQRVIQQHWDKYEKLWGEAERQKNEKPASKKAGKKSSGPEVEIRDSLQSIHRPGDQYQADTLADQDYLNRKNLINAVATWISSKKNTRHIALGLFGEWGTGKSTFLKHLKEATSNSDDVHCIWGEFNAWRYEHSGNIQAGVAQEAVTALKNDLSWTEQWILTLQYALHKHTYQLSVIFVGILASIGLWSLGGELKLTDNGVPEVVLGASAQLVFFVYMYKKLKQAFSHPLAEQLKTYLKLPDYGEHLGTIPVMREQLQLLTKLRINWPKRKSKEKNNKLNRFVFVVDDLDRCSPSGVVKTLEAVRLVMDLPNVVVIIAIDQRIALASLALHYKALSEHHAAEPLTIARDYLGKVINIPIVLEKSSAKEIHNFLDNHLWAEDEGQEKSEELPATTDAISGNAPVQPHNTTDEINTEPAEGTGTNVTANIDATHIESQNNNATQIKTDIPTPPAIDEPKIKETKGLSPTQKTLFKDWVNIFRFSNPRQIKRLNNAYALIRLRHADEDQLAADSQHPRLVLMLWLEYLHELPIQTRCELMKPLLDSDFEQTNWKHLDQHHQDMWNKVKDYVSTTGKELRDIYREVQPFVLPAVEQFDFSAASV
jgi:hypothetical protein